MQGWSLPLCLFLEIFPHCPAGTLVGPMKEVIQGKITVKIQNTPVAVGADLQFQIQDILPFGGFQLLQGKLPINDAVTRE